MASDFSGYEKIPSRLKGKGYGRFDKTAWVATEKIHGANFSFVYHDGHLRVAKRRGFLGSETNFFSHQHVVAKIQDNFMALFAALNAEIHPNVAPEHKTFTVYGELFGGGYPHPDVKPIKGMPLIQHGVYYSPDIRFCAFDISIHVRECHKRYMDYQDAIAYFKRFGIYHAKPLLIGPLHEVMNFDIRTNSTIPAELGFPALSKNMMEGIVVKPYADYSDSYLHRPIVKIKNQHF